MNEQKQSTNTRKTEKFCQDMQKAFCCPCGFIFIVSILIFVIYGITVAYPEFKNVACKLNTCELDPNGYYCSFYYENDGASVYTNTYICSLADGMSSNGTYMSIVTLEGLLNSTRICTLESSNCKLSPNVTDVSNHLWIPALILACIAIVVMLISLTIVVIRNQGSNVPLTS